MIFFHDTSVYRSADAKSVFIVFAFISPHIPFFSLFFLSFFIALSAPCSLLSLFLFAFSNFSPFILASHLFFLFFLFLYFFSIRFSLGSLVDFILFYLMHAPLVLRNCSYRSPRHLHTQQHHITWNHMKSHYLFSSSSLLFLPFSPHPFASLPFPSTSLSLPPPKKVIQKLQLNDCSDEEHSSISARLAPQLRYLLEVFLVRPCASQGSCTSE